MDPNRTIKSTASGRRAAAARDGRLERGQEPTRPLMLSSEAAPAGSGHTPGPWFVHATGRTAAFRTVSVCYQPPMPTAPVPVCEFPGHWPKHHQAEINANAALIAVAPEMLEALVIAEANLWPHTGSGDAITDAAWRKVRSVIAKARGEPS